MLATDIRTVFNNHCSAAKEFEKEKDLRLAIKYYRKALKLTPEMHVEDKYHLKIYSKIRKLHRLSKPSQSEIESDAMAFGPYFCSYKKTIQVCQIIFGEGHPTSLQLYLDMGSQCCVLAKTTKYKTNCYTAALGYYGQVVFTEPVKQNKKMRKEAADAIKKVGARAGVRPAPEGTGDEATTSTLVSSGP